MALGGDGNGAHAVCVWLCVRVGKHVDQPSRQGGPIFFRRSLRSGDCPVHDALRKSAAHPHPSGRAIAAHLLHYAPGHKRHVPSPPEIGTLRMAASRVVRLTSSKSIL